MHTQKELGLVAVLYTREEYSIWKWRLLQCRDRPYISGTASLIDNFFKQKRQILENILQLIVWSLEYDNIFLKFFIG